MLALMLASLMVVFVLPGTAAGYIPGQEESVPFKGTVHFGAWVTYEEYTQEFSLQVADGRLLDSGGKKGTPGQVVTFNGLYEDQPCDLWQVAAAERFDTAFTGSLNMVLDLVADHRVLPELTGYPGACAWEDIPIVHEHFVGTVTFDLVVEPAEQCPKKGPKSGCNRSETLSGNFTVDLANTPVDGTWTGEDFFQSWWGANRYNGTYTWTEPIIPVPQH